MFIKRIEAKQKKECEHDEPVEELGGEQVVEICLPLIIELSKPLAGF